MTDSDAHEFYKDPEHLAASGPGQRRGQPMKTGMIPVRFTPDMIAVVKRFASQDSVTVSTWIRNIIAREIERRQPSATVPAVPPADIKFDYAPAVRPQSETFPSSMPELLCAR